MEKNIYAIIQDWHELFKNGTITEDEFTSKKNELLNFEKLKAEAEKKVKEIEKTEFEKSKKFFNKAYIFTGLIFALIISFIIYSKVKNNEEDNIQNQYYENAPIENDTVSNIENEQTVNETETEEKYINVVNPNNDDETINFLKNNLNQEYCYRENTEDEKNENGYSMFKLKLIISSENEISGTFGYFPNKDVDSWNGEIKGKLVGNIIEGNYSYEAEGNSNNEKFEMYIDQRHTKIIFNNGETRNLGIVKDCESYKFKN